MAGHGHGGGHGAGHGEANHKGIALLIAVLALLLSFSEIGTKYAEKEMVERNIEASNLWAFFQAKTVRRTAYQVASEQLLAQQGTVGDSAVKAIIDNQISKWQATIKRYEDEPSTNEGRKQLAARAQKAELARDKQKARNELFEGSSAFLQIAIVLASATIITGIAALMWFAIGLGGLALVVMSVAMLRPEILMALLHH